METEQFTEGHVKLLEPSISGHQLPFPPVKQHSKFYFDRETVDNKSHHVDCPLPNSHCY